MYILLTIIGLLNLSRMTKLVDAIGLATSPVTYALHFSLTAPPISIFMTITSRPCPVGGEIKLSIAKDKVVPAATSTGDMLVRVRTLVDVAVHCIDPTFLINNYLLLNDCCMLLMRLTLSVKDLVRHST